SRRVDGISEATLFSAVRDPEGNILIGTGNEGKILRVLPAGKVEALATLPEKEVTALAVSPEGVLYAGGSPGGKIYRIEKGKAAPYYETKAQYVWALAFAGKTLYAATGLPGEIHRVSAAGKGERLHATRDPHVRSLYADSKGRLWAGTAGSGLVLRVDPSGAVSTVYDSSKSEITSITGSGDGRVWVAASSAEMPPRARSRSPLLPLNRRLGPPGRPTPGKERRRRRSPRCR
ncbi:MAG TPA: two-component regulator propeller domain-containing protein, partial [Thermoanaerobaculia bacterium]|nr:two-component regulator propeller domain-containing protein [Thermoanaerobaculia bacterium]